MKHSEMKVLFTGRGSNSGTWRMRGVEMASAKEGWKAIPFAKKHDLRGMDAVVIVKRITEETLEIIRQWGGPFLYDALDFWRQTLDDFNISSLDDIRRVFHTRFLYAAPHVVLCTNKLMAEDIASLGFKTQVHYHHYDPRLQPYSSTMPNTILYWGRIEYLGEWHKIMTKTCKKMGKKFLYHRGNNPIMNKPHLNAAAMFAVRGGNHGTWLAKRWKSGIKGITAARLGIPFIAQQEQSYMEQCPHRLFTFHDEDELERAILLAFAEKDKDYITTPSLEYSLENCANKLENIIKEAMFYV